MTATPRQRDVRTAERGFVLVTVLWILAALSALAVVFAVYLTNAARALAVNDAPIVAEGLVMAAVELTAYQLHLAAADTRPDHGSFHTRLNGADLAVSFVSEAARVDLNAAPKELLANLFAGLGARSEDAAEAADRVVGWRTRPTADSADREDALYRAAGRLYPPRQGLFANVGELALVLGLTPELVERALPFVTVYSGSSGVDVLIADPEVVAAMPGMTPLVLKDFLSTRSGLPNDPAAIAAALGPAQAGATTQKSQAYRILTRIAFGGGRETTSEVVISVGEEKDPEPYRVLSWQDGVVATRRPRAREEL